MGGGVRRRPQDVRKRTGKHRSPGVGRAGHDQSCVREDILSCLREPSEEDIRRSTTPQSIPSSHTLRLLLQRLRCRVITTRTAIVFSLEEARALIVEPQKRLRILFMECCACRAVIDEDGPICRYGFAYGTLGEHGERGEERSTVNWDRSEGSVCTRSSHFPRRHWLGYAMSRTLQRRFTNASKAEMAAATARSERPF